MDFSPIIPPGVGIASASLFIETNNQPPAIASGDFSSPHADPAVPNFFSCEVRGRAVYVFLRGGVSGRDYRLIWTAIDTEGNEYPRTALLLCGQTS